MRAAASFKQLEETPLSKHPHQTFVPTLDPSISLIQYWLIKPDFYLWCIQTRARTKLLQRPVEVVKRSFGRQAEQMQQLEKAKAGTSTGALLGCRVKAASK